jgi:hypothetical protein
MAKIGRNDPCWCGSGIKFKKCHLGRSELPRVPIQEVLSQLRQCQDRKYCSHPDAAKGACQGKIVRAHTIQRNGGLSRIARDGHVYSFIGNNPIALSQSDGIIIPKLIGLASASTFNGFCEYHDNLVFAPIEKAPFEAKEEHAFLLSYRIVAKELFGKKMQSELMPVGKTMDRGLSIEQQRIHQQEVAAVASGVDAGLKDAEQHKAVYDTVLQTGDFSSVCYLVVNFDRMPDVLCASGHLPQYDFEGRTLQDLGRFNRRCEQVTFGLIATDTGGAGVFTWIGENQSAIGLVRSLNSQPDEDIPHSIIRYIFEFFENSYFSPSWWESLDQATRDALQARFNRAANLFEKREANCLVDDGVQAVDWKVVSIQTNVTL